MNRHPSIEFQQRVLDALPPDGSSIPARAVYDAICRSTPAYVRIVLGELLRRRLVKVSGIMGQRVYSRARVTHDYGCEVGADHVWRFHAYRQGLHGLAFRKWNEVEDGRSIYSAVYDYSDKPFVTTRQDWDLP